MNGVVIKKRKKNCVCLIYHKVLILLMISQRITTKNMSINHFPPISIIENILRHSPFFGRLGPVNLRARGCQTQQKYFQKYTSSLFELSSPQKTKVLSCLRKACDDSTVLAHFYTDHAVYVCGFEGVEDNQPHTLENVIMLPRWWWNADTLDEHQREIFKHEFVHIYQRYNRREVEAFIYSRGYRKRMHTEGVELCRINPDTDEWLYSHEMISQGEVIYPKFNSRTPSGVSDVTLSCLESGTALPRGIYEHPYEEMAYTF